MATPNQRIQSTDLIQFNKYPERPNPDRQFNSPSQRPLISCNPRRGGRRKADSGRRTAEAGQLRSIGPTYPSPGRPSALSARMFFWTSSVPPPMVRARANSAWTAG